MHPTWWGVTNVQRIFGTIYDISFMTDILGVKSGKNVAKIVKRNLYLTHVPSYRFSTHYCGTYVYINTSGTHFMMISWHGNFTHIKNTLFRESTGGREILYTKGLVEWRLLYSAFSILAPKQSGSHGSGMPCRFFDAIKSCCSQW